MSERRGEEEANDYHNQRQPSPHIGSIGAGVIPIRMSNSVPSPAKRACKPMMQNLYSVIPVKAKYSYIG